MKSCYTCEKLKTLKQIYCVMTCLIHGPVKPISTFLQQPSQQPSQPLQQLLP